MDLIYNYYDKKNLYIIMEMNVKQYQEIYGISSGTTGIEYTKAVMKIMNIDGNKFTINEVKEKIDNIKIPETSELKKFKVKIGGKNYSIVKNIMKASFNEWIQFGSIVGSSTSEEDMVKNLHKILAIFVRPTQRRRFFWDKITPLSDVDLDDNEEQMLKLNIEDALSINVFFYQSEMNFIRNIKRYYLNHRTKLAQVKPGMEIKSKV